MGGNRKAGSGKEGIAEIGDLSIWERGLRLVKVSLTKNL